MATDLIEIDPHEPSAEALDRAVEAILAGLVVAIPTDALYTLIADPFSVPAVRKVYAAKGREIQRALPMLVRDALMVEELAREISPRFRMLARKFWPSVWLARSRGRVWPRRQVFRCFRARRIP